MDNVITMFQSYQSCLQENLDSGRTVGICDNIHSIYQCEFIWRQAAPMSKLVIPKILEIVSGQRGVRGGGEYLGISAAWKNAENSLDYFTNVYGVNAKKAFKARNLEEAGSPICKNFISIVSPGGNLVDSLLAPDSPHQFNANFEEIPFTTATVPPQFLNTKCSTIFSLEKISELIIEFI